MSGTGNIIVVCYSVVLCTLQFFSSILVVLLETWETYYTEYDATLLSFCAIQFFVEFDSSWLQVENFT